MWLPLGDEWGFSKGLGLKSELLSSLKLLDLDDL